MRPLLLLLLLSSCGLSRRDSAARAEDEIWRASGEHAPVSEVFLVWDPSLESFYREMVSEIAREASVSLLVQPGADHEQVWSMLEDVEVSGAATHEISLLELGHNSIWVRDFGPIVTRRGKEQRVVDLRYWGQGADDRAAVVIAEEWLGLRATSLDMEIEGGNLLVDGAGRCLASTGILSANPQIDEGALRKMLRTHFGCEHTELLPALPGEPTGHVDMFATFTGPGEVILGQYAASASSLLRNHLEWIDMYLRQRGYRVRRVPMPDQSDGRFRTYTNSLAVNEIVLVPAYGDVANDFEVAARVFSDAYPGREIVPIEASEIIALEGAVHCAAISVPL